MSKHTEGPWQAEGLTVYALQHSGWRKGVEQLENRFTAHVQGARNCPEAESIANAHLIAAAPDLLEALEFAREGIAAFPRSLGYEYTHLSRIDAAIAKAKEQS